MTDQLSRPDSRSSTAASRELPRSILRSMSDLLDAAISVARTLDPATYHPISIKWHEPDDHGLCLINLSGSLIAKTLQGTPDQRLTPFRFPIDTPGKLEALDALSGGYWVTAFRKFYTHWPTSSTEQRLRQLPKPSNVYFTGWHAFRAHLDSLEAILPQLREIEETRHLF